MNRKTDPDDFNSEQLRAEGDRLLSLHHKWLKELFVAIRGNGDVKHGLEWKVATIQDRQTSVVNFVDDAKKENVIGIAKTVNRVLWIMISGAVSAVGILILMLIKLLMEHGKF